MDWIPKPGVAVDSSDEPRLLSLDEIKSIVDRFPPVLGADEANRKGTRQQLISYLFEGLKEIKIAPSAIPELVTEIVRRHQSALVEPESPVGITAAESVGASTTQMTLKTFHSAGSKKSASYGIEAMRELLFARRKRRHESSTIYFQDKHLSFTDVIEKRSVLVGSTVADFISNDPDRNYDLDSPAALPRYWWHDVYPALMRKKVPPSSLVLRLYFNVNELYAQRVSLEQIASIIEREIPPSVTVLHSPLHEGIMDIYPNVDVIRRTLENRKYIPDILAEQTYLKCIVLPELAKIHIKGISGIRSLFPVVSPVWQLVLEQKRVKVGDFAPGTLLPYGEETLPYEQLLPRLWWLVYNRSRMQVTGLSPENLAALCAEAGIVVAGQSPDATMMLVAMPSAGKDTPQQLTQGRIKEARKAEEAYVEEQVQAGVTGVISPPPNPLIAASEFVYAETNGSNLVDLLGHPEIDSTRTITNNIHEVAAVLGIEACRSLFIRELNDVIENSESYVNQRHISLIADFITSRGRPHGITFSGISRQPVGFISLSTFERAPRVYADAAFIGRTENVSNVSTSIALGLPINVGSGGFDIEPDRQAIQEFEERMAALDEQVGQATVSGDSLAAGIDELTRALSGLSTEEAKIDLLGIDRSSQELNPLTRSGTGAPPVSPAKRPEPMGLQERNPSAAPLTKGTPVVSRQLLDVLAQLRVGATYPASQGERLVIAPLATGLRQAQVQAPPPTPVPLEFQPPVATVGLSTLPPSTTAAGFAALPPLTDYSLSTMAREVREEQAAQPLTIDPEQFAAAIANLRL